VLLWDLGIVLRKSSTLAFLVGLVALVAVLAVNPEEVSQPDFESFVLTYYNRLLSVEASEVRRYYISLLPTEREIDLIYLKHVAGAKRLAAKLRAKMETMTDDEIDRELAVLRQKGELKGVLRHDAFVRLLKEKRIIPQELIVGSASLQFETGTTGMDAFAWVNNRWVIVPNVHDAAAMDLDDAPQK
jgi:hypothetical protein